jgi:HlyD family secretion protein
MRKWIVPAAIVLVIAVPVTMSVLRGGEAKQVEVESVALRAIAPSILASGTLAYESEVHLVPEVVGRVLKLNVKEGDRVKEGDLLIQLDPATSKAEIAQLEAAQRQSRLNIERQKVTLDTQTAKWKRYQTLRTSGIVDANTYEEITSQRDLARVELQTSLEMLGQTQAQLKQARERLAKTEIRAPMSGKVTAVFIKQGETAVPSAMSIAGSDLMVIANTASLYAEVNVDEADVARVNVGQAATIAPAAFPDRNWNGTVEQVAISPKTQAGQSKAYLVRIKLEQQEEQHFRPGMSCRAEISTRLADAAPILAVPVQSVRYEDSDDVNRKSDKATVYVARDGKAQKRDIETGAADDTYIAIVKGVGAGEQVVTGPAKVLRFLHDGDRVAASAAAASVSSTATASAAADSTAHAGAALGSQSALPAASQSSAASVPSSGSSPTVSPKK